MKSRQTLVALFSTFVEFTDDCFHRWVSDRALEKTMRSGVAEQPESLERDWVLYWHHQWKSRVQERAEAHLCAYVQEPCYWVAQRMAQEQTGAQYPVSDCFQIAIASLPRTLKAYQPAQLASLKTYANLAFGNAIRDTLRQQQQADQRTDWGLLRKISQKQLAEALLRTGNSEHVIAQARSAWICFKTYCAPEQTPSTRKLVSPNWHDIARLYNQQNSPKSTPEALEATLKQCAKQVRDYLYPAIVSLNVSRENGSGEWQDDLPDEAAATPLALLIRQEEFAERQSQWMQIQIVLKAALEQLDPTVQQGLTLYYRDGLTQQAIAKQFDTKQYTISRRLSSAKEALLFALAQWSQESLHISLTSPALKNMSVVLEEWLQTYYKNSDRYSSEDQ